MKEDSEEIVLNRMYSGDFLKYNLGHEVINVYESDNNGYFLYLNSKGSFDKKHESRIKQMLLVRSTSYNACVELIGIANNLSDVPFDAQAQTTLINNVTYGGITLAQLFGNNQQQIIYITFKAKNVLRPQKPTYLVFKNGTTDLDTNKNINVIHLKCDQAKSSLKQYFEAETPDYQTLQDKLFSNFQGTPMPKVDISKLQRPTDKNFFEVCGIDNSELAFSNAFAYFIKKYPTILQNFASQKGHNVDCNNLVIKRETEENIDIFIETPSHIIVIENKVLSDINGRDHTKTKGESQLKKYYEHVTKKLKSDKQKLFVVLTPDHNNIDIKQFDCGDKYTKLFYSELRQFLIDYVAKNKLQDPYLNELISAMEKHSQKFYNELYDRTEKLFYETIKEEKNK